MVRSEAHRDVFLIGCVEKKEECKESHAGSVKKRQKRLVIFEPCLFCRKWCRLRTRSVGQRVSRNRRLCSWKKTHVIKSVAKGFTSQGNVLGWLTTDLHIICEQKQNTKLSPWLIAGARSVVRALALEPKGGGFILVKGT